MTSKRRDLGLIIMAALFCTSCGGGAISPDRLPTDDQAQNDNYLIGPGDSLQVFVWGHQELSIEVQVRPDGEISTPLVEDMQAAGRTPTELARAVEGALRDYVRSPTVTIIVQSFQGEYGRQIRVVGQAAEPQALNYRDGMTLLDVMIQVGGLSEFAAGNKAKIVRRQNGEEIAIRAKISDLLNKGDLSKNVEMMPGDVLIIPESVF